MIVLVVDWPWRFGDSLPGKTRGASKQYETMTVHQAREFQLPAEVTQAKDVACFFWRVASMQEEAISVLAAWDLTIKTELVWEKLTRTGKQHFGMGRYLRASHEVCLLATRGRAFPEARNVRSRFSAPVLAHSQKPDAFYSIAETLYPSAPKVELFARVVRPGWTQYGNQLGSIEAAQ